MKLRIHSVRAVFFSVKLKKATQDEKRHSRTLCCRERCTVSLSIVASDSSLARSAQKLLYRHRAAAQLHLTATFLASHSVLSLLFSIFSSLITD